MVVAVGQIIKFRAKYHNITVMSGFYWEALGRGCREERLKKNRQDTIHVKIPKLDIVIL